MIYWVKVNNNVWLTKGCEQNDQLKYTISAQA